MQMVRRTLATMLLLMVGTLALGAAPASADDAGDEAAFLARLNDLRTSQGLPALAPNSALTGVARAWAGSMAAAGTISHNPSLASQGPSNWARLGENVGMGMDVPSVHNAFVNSPAHYRNMVDAGFDSVGIGVVRNGSGALFVTVNFMQAKAVAVAAPAPAAAAPKPAAPAPAPAPAAAPAPSPARPAPAPAAPAVAAAPAPAAAQPVAPVTPPATTPEAAPAAAPVAPAPVATPVTAAARTTSVGTRSDSASSSSTALGLVCAGVVLAMVAGGLVAFRPQRRAAALARR
jgi:hypothetical protein